MSDKLGLKELIAIGIGSMIGGGIFSVMGLASEISGHATPFVFIMGGIIAAFAGYNYAKLALAFEEDGASYIYLRRAFPKKPFIAAIVGWSVIVGYIGTLALYSYTFGSYAAAMFNFPNSYFVRTLFALSILSIFLGINLKGIKEMGESEDIIVFLKVLIMFIMGGAGLLFIDKNHFIPLFDKGIGSVFLSGAMVFVAFEGFQLITNSVAETKNPSKNTPLSIYLSIVIVTLIYILLAVSTLGILTQQEIAKAKEYAIAEALKPIFGEYGFILASLAALLATSSAINGTLFGASRMMADIAKDKIFPSFLSKKNRKNIPYHALLTMYILAAAFVFYGKLDSIIAFSSMTFLLVSLAVAIANLKLYKNTNSHIFIIIISIILMSATILLMISYMYQNDRENLYAIAVIYLSITVLFLIYQYTKKWRPGQDSNL